MNVILLLILPFSFAGMVPRLPGTIRLPTISAWDIYDPDTDLQVIYITNDKRVFLSFDEFRGVDLLLDSMGKSYSVRFSARQRAQLKKNMYLGTDIRQLPSRLDHRVRFNKQSGIPIDQDNNQLKDWIVAAHKINPKLRTGLYIDEDISYAYLKKIFQILSDLRINRFNLIVNPDLATKAP